MKKALAIVMALCMVFAFCACGQEAAPTTEPAPAGTTGSAGTEAKKTYVIKGTLQDMSNEFMVMLKNAMDDVIASGEITDVELTILDGEGSPEKQVAQIENFIAEGVDAIILCPQDGTALIPAVRQAIEAGIPVIMCSADVDEQVGQVLVGSNHKDAGIMQAEWVVEQLGGKGTIAYLRGPIGHFAEVQRAEGTLEVYAKYPDIQVIFDQTGNWDRDEGMALMETWLQSGKQIDCVQAQNDEMVLGAMRAIEGAGKTGTIITTGIDGIPDAYAAIKAGTLGCTVFQDAVGQGAGALRVAYQAAKGEKVESLIIPWAIVDINNVDEYVK